MNSDIHVIRCHSERCERCPQQNEGVCQQIESIKDFASNQSQVLLVEEERGFLHFCKLSDLQQIEPSWRTEGWESVFIGSNSPVFHRLEDIISIYKVGPYLSMFGRGENSQTKYNAIPLTRTALEYSLIEELSQKPLQIKEKAPLQREKITQRIQRVTHDVSEHILSFIPEMRKSTRMRLSEIIAHRRYVIGPLMPLILDDFIEEIYLDSPGVPVYFDHQKHGRCVTTTTFREDDVPRIVTLVRAESNLHLDRSNPSLKMDLQIQDASLRFSASIPPISPDGLHLEIRRARSDPFSIGDLIDNGTMTPEVASILLLAVSCRFNITITGGPGTGKTTLLNALDMTTPKWWRKIYIEDAVESRKQKQHHQVRFRVDPMDEQLTKFSKSDEIIKCLHRSPDYLILGEIQTAEHSKALFQAIAAGLRTIQTCHSESASGLVTRWKLSHEVQDANLALMDIIVTLERPRPGESKRVVSEIAEIRRSVVDGILEFSGLNVIYENGQEMKDTWSDDGAFLIRAKDLGIESHVPALENLTEVIRKSSCQLTFDTLSERMWNFGHPMKYFEH